MSTADFKEPIKRIVLLGASNATLGFPTVVETARAAWGRPLDVLAAIGLGRSYGAATRVLGRELPGIVQCGLWDDLRRRPTLPLAALITDIGNDLVYGYSVDQIVEWLEICLQRLSEATDKLVVTRLPLESVRAAPEWKFRVLSKLLFPGSHLDRDALLESAAELDRRLIDFAGKYGAYVVSPEFAWYGWDPIHVRGSKKPHAWQKYMIPMANGRSFPPARPSLRCRTTVVYRCRPRRWSLFGFERGSDQPSARLLDGTRLSLY